MSIFMKWAKLSLYIVSIWLFIFVIAPEIQQLQTVKPVHQYIEKNAIDAGALYYTDIEEFSEAEKRVLDAMKYGGHH